VLGTPIAEKRALNQIVLPCLMLVLLKLELIADWAAHSTG
jgi:hypothetical protein